MNVVDLPKNPSDLEKSIAEFKKNLALLMEYTAMSAQLRRAEYNALVANGFTPQQALEIIKK